MEGQWFEAAQGGGGDPMQLEAAIQEAHREALSISKK